MSVASVDRSVVHVPTIYFKSCHCFQAGWGMCLSFLLLQEILHPIAFFKHYVLPTSSLKTRNHRILRLLNDGLNGVVCPEPGSATSQGAKYSLFVTCHLHQLWYMCPYFNKLFAISLKFTASHRCKCISAAMRDFFFLFFPRKLFNVW